MPPTRPSPEQKLLNIIGGPANTFSSKCMVTPQISGLVNGDTLAALAKNGLQCAAGDNTWSHLKNLKKPHQMLVTTKASPGGTEALARYPPTAIKCSCRARCTVPGHNAGAPCICRGPPVPTLNLLPSHEPRLGSLASAGTM